MKPLFHTDCSISDSLKSVRKSVLIYETIIILRIDCGKAEDGLITTPNSQRMLDALAIDNPLEYARLYLDSEMQDWVNAMNMEWYST